MHHHCLTNYMEDYDGTRGAEVTTTQTSADWSFRPKLVI